MPVIAPNIDEITIIVAITGILVSSYYFCLTAVSFPLKAIPI